MADFVMFRTNDGQVLVNVDNVIYVDTYLEAGNEVTYLNFVDGGNLSVKEPFEDVAAKLLRLF